MRPIPTDVCLQQKQNMPIQTELECGPMSNVMATHPSISVAIAKVP